MDDAEVVEAFLEGGSATGPVGEPQNTDHVRGARRAVGAPTRVLLVVGVGDEAATALESGDADATVDAADPPESWVQLIRDLLG